LLAAVPEVFEKSLEAQANFGGILLQPIGEVLGAEENLHKGGEGVGFSCGAAVTSETIHPERAAMDRDVRIKTS
jgi:hypothetical protein